MKIGQGNVCKRNFNFRQFKTFDVQFCQQTSKVQILDLSSKCWGEKIDQGMAKLVSISAPKNYNAREKGPEHHIKSDAQYIH